MNDTTIKLGRFGHHPDPAIDYCEEVTELLAIFWNLEHGIRGDDPAEYRKRLTRAAAFVVGGDASAVLARQQLQPLIDTEERMLAEDRRHGPESLEAIATQGLF